MEEEVNKDVNSTNDNISSDISRLPGFEHLKRSSPHEVSVPPLLLVIVRKTSKEFRYCMNLIGLLKLETH
jgi:hypothetical protein